jgi:hypothetical protein
MGHERGVLFFAMELIEGDPRPAIERGPVPARRPDRQRGRWPATRARVRARSSRRQARQRDPGRRWKEHASPTSASCTTRRTPTTRSHYVLGTPATPRPSKPAAHRSIRAAASGAGAVLTRLGGRPPFTAVPGRARPAGQRAAAALHQVAPRPVRADRDLRAGDGARPGAALRDGQCAPERARRVLGGRPCPLVPAAVARS